MCAFLLPIVYALFVQTNVPKRQSPLQTASWWCGVGLDQDGLEVKFISDYKGEICMTLYIP